ncbi:MAG: MarR family winged helix-turn-helix transcriptional regulator [Acidimicrobiales bacterium]
MPKASTLRPGPVVGTPEGSTQDSVDRIQAAFQVVARAITQVRVHERLLQQAGVRLDRAGSALLYKLYERGDAPRVTDLAEQLGVDAPTVTRKIQQLERERLVTRRADPDDRRAARIALTPAGRRTLERVLAARRAWFDRMFEGWDEEDKATFAAMLSRFSAALEYDIGDGRDG